LSARLDALERTISSLPGGDLLSLLFKALSTNLAVQGDLAAIYRKVAETRNVLRREGLYDSITLAIVELLALHGPLNISELAELLRRTRGRASRKTIARRLKILEALGLVKRVKGRGKRYALTGKT